MADHRQSYLKTMVVVSIPTLMGLAAVGYLLGLFWMGPGAFGRAIWGLLAIAVASGVAWLILVLAGGVLALRRDRIETLGLPYTSTEPRERSPGPWTRALGRWIPRRATRLGLQPGELVLVRPLDQILATLDTQGTLGGLPFMPEMAAFCGKRFRVFRRADKVLDWVQRSGLRRLRDTVLLEQLHCDGAAHGGCQAWCHLQWREAWLRRVDAAGVSAATRANERPSRLSEADLHRLARRQNEGEAPRYVCQVTQLAAGGTPLAWGDPSHYLRDLWSGNTRLGPLLVSASLALFNWVQRLRGGAAFPFLSPAGVKSAPAAALDFKVGERVRVRPKSEIEATLNADSRNRGLWFDAEMVRHCGAEYCVQSRVSHLVEERTGKLIEMKNPCLILEDVTATGEYLGMCAQNEAIFWREVWLQRPPS